MPSFFPISLIEDAGSLTFSPFIKLLLFYHFPLDFYIQKHPVLQILQFWYIDT